VYSEHKRWSQWGSV